MGRTVDATTARSGSHVDDGRWRRGGAAEDGLSSTGGASRAHVAAGPAGSAERASRAERRYAAVVAASLDALVVADRFGVVTAWNPQAARLFGWEEAEAIGRPVADLIVPPRLRDAHRTALSRHRETGRTSVIGRRVELVGMRKDGTEFPVELTITVAGEGGDSAYVASLRDLSERNAQQAALQESERRYRQLFELSMGIIATHDGAGVVSSVNPSGAAILGYAPGELVGTPLADLVHPSVRPRLAEYFEEIRTRGSSKGVLDVVTRRGERRRWAYRNILVDPGTSSPYVLIHAQDVTDHHRVFDALRRSEAEYRELVEHAAYGIYRVTPEGRFLAVNGRLVSMLGYRDADELLAVDEASIYVSPQDRARFVRADGAGPAVVTIETGWRRKDGSRMTVRLSGRRTRDAASQTDCFEMFVEDVTERRALEAQLRQAQKMEAVGQLAGGLAHDFNNLLTTVLGNADFLAERPPEPEFSAIVAEVRAAARRGAALIRKLMTVSRRDPLTLEAVDLAALCADTVAMLRRLLPAHIEIAVRSEPGTPAARADRLAVEQILLNLATNARDAMPGGGRLAIRIGAAEIDDAFVRSHGFGTPGPCVLLAVSDTGTGMEAAARARVFEPFFTTKPAGEGTGLGLAMVYGLMKQHEGFVDLASEPGRGTCVDLYFPLAGLAESPAAREPTPATAGGDETILLVEDDPGVRRTAAAVLRRAGYHVLTASDGEEALAALRTGRPAIDLVLSDVVMPRLGGRELHAASLELPRVPAFVFASGHAARDVRESGPLDPTVPFLAKPWSVAALLHTVRDTLDRRTPPPA